MLTDIQTIMRFFNEGRIGFARTNLSFIGVGLFLQLLAAFGQNKNRGMKVVAYEWLIILSMLKPAVDARRVYSGNKLEKNALVVPQLELTAMKCIEIFAKNIPSSIVQSYALFGANGVSGAAMFSIAISVISMGYSSAIISMDYDTDPAKRLISPSFYGDCPDTNRLQVMILMVIMTASHVFMKVLAYSLILNLSIIWFMIYYVGDMNLYFFFKMLRGDFRYRLRLEGLFSWIVTVLIRTVIKCIVDFTLIVQFRHPFELGGMYWSGNIVLNQLFCFASVCLYKKHLNDVISDNMNYRDGSEKDVKVSPRCNHADFDSYNVDYVCAESGLEASLWNVVICLFVLSMLSFGGFLFSINREYWVTFLDMRTVKQIAVDNYKAAETDVMRFNIFTIHESIYSSISEELNKWLNDNWDRWEEEKPDWFTAAIISKFPKICFL